MCRFAPLCVTIGLFAVLAAPAPPALAAFTGEVELALRPAPLGRAEAEAGPTTFLHLEARDGAWERPWAKSVGIFEHTGLVDAAEVTESRIRLGLRLAIEGDFWTKGRWLADYSLDLARAADGTLSGTYEGRYAGEPVAGVVEGEILTPRPVREGFAPPEPDEHPRVLFRRQDIPRLRAKLDTPFGRAYRERAATSGDVINLGVLYQLTGEKAWADRAMQAIKREYMDSGDGRIPVYGFGSGGFGHEIFQTALAYDLCLDAWPASFNAWLREQFEAFTERQQLVLMTSHANYHPCSNYYGPGRGVPGVVSMILWGDGGPMPPAPRSPLDRAWRVAPPKGYVPGKGVEVTELAPGKLPTAWIWTGELPYECSRDVLTGLGGYEKARPEVGAVTDFTVKTDTWFKVAPLEMKPLPAEAATPAGIDLGRLGGDGKAFVAVFFAAVEVKSEQTVALEGTGDEVRVWLSGVELTRDNLYRLYPGLHTMTVELRARAAHGTLAPRIVAVREGGSNNLVALYRLDKDLWDRDRAEHERTGVLPVRRFWLRRGWFQNYEHYRWGVGDGGFMTETGGYAQISSWYPSVYASMYPNFFGREVSAHPDVDCIMPRQIMQSVFPAPDPSARRTGGRPVALRLNSCITLNPQWLACHFPIIPEAYKPSALWVWNYLMGVTDEASVPMALGSGRSSTWGLGGLTLAQTFVNYPLDMRPIHPRQGMPRQWRADTFGHYVFRSGFEAGDEFVAQTFGKSSLIKGWNHPNAGSFQVWGLGHPWTTTDDSPGTIRDTYSIVLLPDDEINASGCGQLVDYAAEADGSGSLTFDLGDVYARPSPGLYNGMLMRDGSRRVPSGITGLRAFGFDYSGKSGAAALMVIVDRIEGGGRRLWAWQKPGGATVSLDDGGFTLAYPDASMKATFVTPAAPALEYADDDMKEGGDAKHGFWGTLHRVKARADGGSFFVVLTFQRGDPPEVRVEGEGLGAKVTVGGQTVRFDGRRVVFGE